MLKKFYINKLFIILKSFLFRYLFKDIKAVFLFITKYINSFDLKNINIFLPKKIKKFSVVRSPTMSKLSKEQFEFRFYKAYLIFILFNHLDCLSIKSFFIYLDLNYSYLKYKTFFQSNA